MINSKEKIINYFKSGIKEAKNFKIGIEHEKFLFNNNDNRRIDYSKIMGKLNIDWNQSSLLTYISSYYNE